MTTLDSGTRTIHSQRNKLNLNLSTCAPKAEISTTMPHLAKDTNLASANNFAEGSMVDPEMTTLDFYSLGEITMTARTPIFTNNAGTSTLNTPDITAVNLEDIFNVPESILSTPIQDVDPTPTTTANETEFEFVDAMTQLEHESIWGQETFNTVFETNDFGLCAPANVVEGTIIDEDITDATVDVVDNNGFLQMENMDILQWVVNDQNNEASKRCRAKRKRKHQEAEDELVLLQEKNMELRAKMDEMEREVQILKKRFLTNISVKNKTSENSSLI